MLIIMGGLPGTGKTTIARGLARALKAIHLRIDSIEQALRESGRLQDDLWDAGYRVGYAVAADNLRLGATVIADSVNPIAVTRAAWREAAERIGAKAVEIEVVCSDGAEHRRRVETRDTDIAGFKLPTWAEVAARDYEPWPRPHEVVDTALEGVDAVVERLAARVLAIHAAAESRSGRGW